jgi:hypothetical protein
MSKKGLEKFYNEALPTLKRKYRHSIHYGDISFTDYDAECYIRKTNGQIEKARISGIENLEGSLIRLYKRPTIYMLDGIYRWGDDYGRTWALTKDELIQNRKVSKPRGKVNTKFVIVYKDGKKSQVYKRKGTAQNDLDRSIKLYQMNLEDTRWSKKDLEAIQNNLDNCLGAQIVQLQ